MICTPTIDWSSLLITLAAGALGKSVPAAVNTVIASKVVAAAAGRSSTRGTKFTFSSCCQAVLIDTFAGSTGRMNSFDPPTVLLATPPAIVGGELELK